LGGLIELVVIDAVKAGSKANVTSGTSTTLADQCIIANFDVI
jgi:hypothetical protein